ncbi:glycerate kinase [bacterium E08(2017)]|nr:glycerate kinase [bacterium E08(2017)]
MKKKKRLKVGIAPDSFKGTLSSLEAATLIERGLKKAIPDVICVKIPVADGGEGTVQALVEATGGKFVRRSVAGPLGKKVRAKFGISGDGNTAIMEMAEASGLALLKPAERNPLKTSTYGTGELIKAALDLGARKILIGIGGSATNDCGTGMARALGVKFLDSKGRSIKDCGGALKYLDRIDMSGLDERLKEVQIEVACDVDNPLTGPRGAAQVYGPQKGASPAMVDQLDESLKNTARIIKRDVGIDILRVPGSGAAGGLGGGLMAFTGGVLRPGIDIVMDAVQLARRFKGCDLVITGEGSMDGQTVYGKTPAGVAKIAKKQGLPVIAICGRLGKGVQKVLKIGIDAYTATLEFSIKKEEDIPKLGPVFIERKAEQVGRILKIGSKLKM